MTETGVKLAAAANHGKQCRKKGTVNKEITDYYGVKGELRYVASLKTCVRTV